MFKTICMIGLFSYTLLANISQYDVYFQKAGAHYNIPPILLQNIASIESSGNPNAIRHNDNGSNDYGLMQINSIHFRRLSAWGINERNILNPEINIFVGGWLLSEHIKERGFNWNSIGNYHSKTKIHQDKWLKRLTIALNKSN
ncbi:MAG: lytic transglycosylase domain-containing protein [Sulfuricurvum sp.]